jgi:hypothetical protein
VGQDLLTIPDSGTTRLLYPYLAEQLAAYLNVSSENLPQSGELNEVAYRFLAQGNQIEDIYPALKTVALKAENLPIPEPLLKLADIRPLQLFVTTTFDSCLARAINLRRYGGNLKTHVLAYSPNQVEDVPADFRGDGRPIVYQLFGKLSATPAYAVTQEDILEFFHSLQSETRQPKLLFDELNRRSLVILGSRFSGWLARFFIRMSKAQRLSAGGKSDYLADAEVTSDPSLVMFLRHFSKATKVFPSGSALEFVDELHRRWMERHANTSAQATAPVGSETAELQPVQGAVFLSYASGDITAVVKIKAALEAAGVDVFLDRDRLHAGSDWDATLRRSIHQCSLFVPVISRETLTRERRYFRVEWKLALEEAQMAPFSEDAAFLLPVVIDDTPVDEPELPAKFRALQWSSLPGGEPTPAFVGRVQQLYRKYQKSNAGAR